MIVHNRFWDAEYPALALSETRVKITPLNIVELTKHKPGSYRCVHCDKVVTDGTECKARAD